MGFVFKILIADGEKRRHISAKFPPCFVLLFWNPSHFLRIAATRPSKLFLTCMIWTGSSPNWPGDWCTGMVILGDHHQPARTNIPIVVGYLLVVLSLWLASACPYFLIEEIYHVCIYIYIDINYHYFSRIWLFHSGNFSSLWGHVGPLYRLQEKVSATRLSAFLPGRGLSGKSWGKTWENYISSSDHHNLHTILT